MINELLFSLRSHFHLTDILLCIVHLEEKSDEETETEREREYAE